jgi:hypothetical protein
MRKDSLNKIGTRDTYTYCSLLIRGGHTCVRPHAPHKDVTVEAHFTDARCEGSFRMCMIPLSKIILPEWSQLNC